MFYANTMQKQIEKIKIEKKEIALEKKRKVKTRRKGKINLEEMTDLLRRSLRIKEIKAVDKFAKAHERIAMRKDEKYVAET